LLHNFKIAPVLSAEQALERLEKETFDVVVADYAMPGMNGLEFLGELRKKGNDIPFIIAPYLYGT
jgi:CheY-like chemotaxis protein